jgi:hypothetical protein
LAAHGPDHPDVAKVLTNLAVLSRAQGRNYIAEPLFRLGASSGLSYPSSCSAAATTRRNHMVQAQRLLAGQQSAPVGT